MTENPRIAGAYRRAKELDVANKRTEALLAEYEADDNQEGVSEALGQLALLRAEGNALGQMFQEELQRTTPQQAKPRKSILTSNKDISEYTLEDQLEIVNQTMNGRAPLTADDLRKAVADNQGAWDNRPGQK